VADDASSGPLRDLEDEATVATMRRFDLAETTALLRSYGYVDVDPDLRSTLWRLTGGKPLFLQRVIALGPPDRAAGRIPYDDVKTVIVRAASRLDEKSLRVLGWATVLGSPFGLEAAAVADCTVAELNDAMREGERIGLVTVDEQRERFSFTHELVREALQERLTVRERCEAHGRAADALGRQPATADSQRLARVAHQAVRSAPRTAITMSDLAEALVRRDHSGDRERATELLLSAMQVERHVRCVPPAMPV
jgi:hypothetical protein